MSHSWIPAAELHQEWTDMGLKNITTVVLSDQGLMLQSGLKWSLGPWAGWGETLEVLGRDRKVLNTVKVLTCLYPEKN